MLNYFYTKGVDTTKLAVDKAMQTAVHTSTLSLGLAIVTTQMGLIATTSATNMLLSSLIYTKQKGIMIAGGALAAEQAVEARIRDTIEYSLQMAKVPGDKIVEQTNSFLDIANAVFDKMLGLPEEKETPDSSVGDRIRFLSRRISTELYKRAHDDVIDPLSNQVHSIVDVMNQKLVLAETIQKNREWVVENFGNLSNNALELKKKIETEAQQYNISPEEMLVRSIRMTSQKLNENFNQLRANGSELAGENAANKIDAATSYVQQFDNNLEKAKSLYQIRDEVIVEARQKFEEISHWTASFWVGENNFDNNSTVQ